MHAQPRSEIVVHRSVTVPLQPASAFELFTARMTAYWPADHSIGTVPIADVVVEPHAGGRWYERGVDGTECDWGRVAVWDPPGRLVLLWQIGADWRFDPDLETEVDVTFTEDSSGQTLVDLKHRHLERFGDHATIMQGAFGSPNGWAGILSGLQTVSGEPPKETQLRLYVRGLEQIGAVLHEMPETAWDRWSPCTEWTARDIVGHTIWGQQLVHAWATGTEPPSYRYVPGGERPGPLAGGDPVAAWETARAACTAAFDGQALATKVETRALGTTTIGTFLDNLTVDNTAHAWDLAATAGFAVDLDTELVSHSRHWVERHETLVRESGMFGERLTPPATADAQTELLAALGRRSW